MSKINCQILELSEQKIKFTLNGCDASMANSLRRVLISEVPTLAPHLVSVIQNTSVLHDQFLVQRIGLIPFVSDFVDKFLYPWECECALKGSMDDCQICKSYFVLQVKNVDQDILQVTSMDIRPVYQIMVDEEQGLRPVAPLQFQAKQNTNKHKKGDKIGIPIVKLSRNQQINIRFDVQKGIGKMHAKWSPVSLATFQPDPVVKLNQATELTMDQKIAIKNSCPTKVFEVQQGVFEVTNPQKCIFCQQCIKTAQQLQRETLKNFIQIGKKKDRYIFTIESIGTLRPALIVKKGFAALREKLKFLQETIAREGN